MHRRGKIESRIPLKDISNKRKNKDENKTEASHGIKDRTLYHVKQKRQKVSPSNGTITPKNVFDIDKNYRNDLLFCTELAPLIISNWKKEEERVRQKPYFNASKCGTEINKNMRAELIDWISEVSDHLNLSSSTFFSAVQLIDKSINLVSVGCEQLQILGCACLLVSSKYEEVECPGVQEFVLLSDHLFSVPSLINTEGKLLWALQYRVSTITHHNFLARISLAGELDPIEYIAELVTLDYSLMVSYDPSIIASSVVFTVRAMRRKPDKAWTSTLQYYINYEEWEIKKCAGDVYRLYFNEQQTVHQQGRGGLYPSSITIKYSQQVHQCVSSINFTS